MRDDNENKILLFINYSSGLKHNTMCNDLQEVIDNISELKVEENLIDKIPDSFFLKEHFEKEDDYYQIFSNDTWFHIQYFPVFKKK